MEISDNPSLRRDTSDPSLFCTAYRKNRFYIFTRREPEDTKKLVNNYYKIYYACKFHSSYIGMNVCGCAYENGCVVDGMCATAAVSMNCVL